MLSAVIAAGNQEAFADWALEVKRGARLFAQIAVELSGALHLAGDSLLADAAFNQPDHGPRLVARRNPGFQLLAAALLTIAEVEFHLELAADHGGGQFDIGHAVIALHHPARCLAACTNQLALLHRIERIGAFIGFRQRKLASQSGVDRVAVMIKNPQSQHRSGFAIGDQQALRGQEFDPRRTCRIEDGAGQP